MAHQKIQVRGYTANLFSCPIFAPFLDSVVTRLRPKGKYTEYELQPEMTMYSLHIWSQFPAIASNEGRHFRQGAEFYRALCHILAVLSCFSLAE